MTVQIATLDDLRAALAPIQAQLDAVLAQVARPDWMTVAQYAAAHRVSEKTVRRRVNDGVLESKRVGKRLLVKA